MHAASVESLTLRSIFTAGPPKRKRQKLCVPSKYVNVNVCVSFLQSHQEKDAERLQPVHLDYARHVYAVSAVWLPHVLW